MSPHEGGERVPGGIERVGGVDDVRDEPVALPSKARWITQKAICERFGISDETWRRWRKAGETPQPIAAPGIPRWLVSEIDDFERGRFGARAFGTAIRRRVR